jgi:hypothetical protein
MLHSRSAYLNLLDTIEQMKKEIEYLRQALQKALYAYNRLKKKRLKEQATERRTKRQTKRIQPKTGS